MSFTEVCSILPSLLPTEGSFIDQENHQKGKGEEKVTSTDTLFSLQQLLAQSCRLTSNWLPIKVPVVF